MNEVHIGFQTEEQVKIFVKWMQKEGFEQLVKSRQNRGEDIITCLATDEPMEWGGHYFVLE